MKARTIPGPRNTTMTVDWRSLDRQCRSDDDPITNRDAATMIELTATIR
jgi:hypothetical protein